MERSISPIDSRNTIPRAMTPYRGSLGRVGERVDGQEAWVEQADEGHHADKHEQDAQLLAARDPVRMSPGRVTIAVRWVMPLPPDPPLGRVGLGIAFVGASGPAWLSDRHPSPLYGSGIYLSSVVYTRTAVSSRVSADRRPEPRVLPLGQDPARLSTATERRRGPSSSRRMTRCQVPSERRPPSTGSRSCVPTKLDITWASALPGFHNSCSQGPRRSTRRPATRS